MARFIPPVYEHIVSPDESAARPVRHTVIVVGAGPVGLAAAIDLALHGISAIILDEDCTVSTGSRAICWAQRTLEIFDRLGVGQRMLEKGVTWSRGKVFRRDRLLYEFDLLPEGGHRFPAFINLQQYYVEHFLIERLAELARGVRWRNRVVGLERLVDGVRLEIETPSGRHPLECDWLIAADGARSTVRRLMALEFKGQIFEDRFLIADVRMEADFPTERRFWFDPPFHPGQSALLHRQADNVWRIDLQLGWGADPEAEKKPERVVPRLEAMLGPERKFELEWVSVYTFQCRRLDRFRHGRVIFAGDAAHQVSPFGARGGNSGVQDADNLVWKLALVLAGAADEALIDSYDAERGYAADENIRHSTRATDFISPKGAAQRWRDAVLALAAEHRFARNLVNSGRLSRATVLGESTLNARDGDIFTGAMTPGTACADAPVVTAGEPGWLLRRLHGGFVALYFPHRGEARPGGVEGLADAPVPTRWLAVGHDFIDGEGLVVARYDGQPGTCYLIRPDQHVAARWRRFDPRVVRAAIERCCTAKLPLSAVAE
jgi:3-(3-hydroxy-phenyl)propionate hydroxylase